MAFQFEGRGGGIYTILQSAPTLPPREELGSVLEMASSSGQSSAKGSSTSVLWGGDFFGEVPVRMSWE